MSDGVRMLGNAAHRESSPTTEGLGDEIKYACPRHATGPHLLAAKHKTPQIPNTIQFPDLLSKVQARLVSLAVLGSGEEPCWVRGPHIT